MAESLRLAPDPNDELLAKHDPAALTKSTEEILLEIDNIWFGKRESLRELKRCTKLNSRWVLRKTVPIQEHYTIGDKMGNPGSYGLVKSAIHKITKKKFAVKIIKKWIFKSRKLTKLFFKDLRREIRLMNEVQDHPSIIEIERVFESIDKLYIIMSACEGGELFMGIEEDEGFSEKKASKIFGEMLSAIYYLHSRGIAHCDLKPENFLFKHKRPSSKASDDFGSIKLIDFGMAKIVKWRRYHTRLRGTPYYMAPEVIKGKYDQSADMWSMGIILYVMVYGFPPFYLEKANKKRRPEELYKKIAKGFQPKVKLGFGPWFPKSAPVSHDFKDLVARLLRKDVAARMTAEEAVAHPWITKNSKLKTEPLRMIKSLKIFGHNCALKHDILRVLLNCQFLNRDQEAAVEETFRLIDKDGDGVITSEQLLHAIRNVDPKISKQEINEIIAAGDLDCRENVFTIEDFLSARINRKVVQKEERLRKVFHSLDVDRDGVLCWKDISSVLESVSGKSLTEKEAKELISEVESTRDGEIDYEDFLEMFHKSSNPLSSHISIIMSPRKNKGCNSWPTPPALL